MQRRALLGSCATAAFAVTAVPRLHKPTTILSRDPRGWVPPTAAATLRDARVKALALRAVDAAREAGAHYADIRLTNLCRRNPGEGNGNNGLPSDIIRLGLSVRALVDGYWGWVATPMLSIEEGVRAARKAVEFAQRAARTGRPRTAELGTIPVVHDGDWRTPATIDPFSVPMAEVQDVLIELGQELIEAGRVRSRPGESNDALLQLGFSQEERLFASTEGSLLTQSVVILRPLLHHWTYRNVDATIPCFNQPVQAGWEWIAGLSMKTLAEPVMDRIDAMREHPLPAKPFEIGRYDVVFSAAAMASLLGATFGPATQLDRALGYEANATGTSYLGPDPFARLGTQIASPQVNVTADRTTPTAVATAKWDDDGVMTENFPLVTKGILVDYQTTREQAAWLTPWYQKQGRPIRSHGCAGAEDALTPTIQHTPNLILQPGSNSLDFEQLVTGLEHGLVVQELDPHMDFQVSTGHAGVAGIIEVHHGKPTAHLRGGAQILFRATELWKNVEAVGGVGSLQWAISGLSRKGEPSQLTEFSIAAVPARVKQLAFIDPMKKA